MIFAILECGNLPLRAPHRHSPRHVDVLTPENLLFSFRLQADWRRVMPTVGGRLTAHGS